MNGYTGALLQQSASIDTVDDSSFKPTTSFGADLHWRTFVHLS
jgi:hypothetical protein